MKARMSIKGLMLTFLAASLLICPAVGSAADDIKVGILGPMTGPGSLMGQGMRDGALLAMEKINAAGGIKGRKIKPIIMDDQAQITLGVNGIKKLIYKENVLAVLGTPNSPVCLATMQVAKKGKTPQIMFGVAPKITQSGNPWVLRVTPSDMVMATNYVDFAAKKLKLKKLAILHDSSDYGKGALPALKAKMKKLGLKPVIIESFNVGDKDFAGQLNNIKNSGADGVFLWGLYVEGAQILIQAKQLGLNMPFLASSGVLQGAFLKLAGKAANGLYITTYFSLDDPAKRVQDFIKAYKPKYGNPTPTSALAYDGCNVLSIAMKKAGFDKEKIRQYLRNVKGYRGVTGRIETDKNGQGGQSSIIMRVENQVPKVVWSSDQ
ncbi:MAG: ABC transporter substrate-binding protein [Desulfarculaceae bacterium]